MPRGLASNEVQSPDPLGGVETKRTKRPEEVERGEPDHDPVLPLLDLMAANHAVKLGLEIPPTLVRAMDHRHRVLAERYPNAARLPKDARRKLLTSMPRPPAEAAARHQAEWLARARDVISRYG